MLSSGWTSNIDGCICVKVGLEGVVAEADLVTSYVIAVYAGAVPAGMADWLSLPIERCAVPFGTVGLGLKDCGNL